MLDLIQSMIPDNKTNKIVINKTGLPGRYDMHLQYDPNASGDRAERFRAALRDQLGLELVPGRKSMQMLVLERTTSGTQPVASNTAPLLQSEWVAPLVGIR
ncbi:TPA: hypothetical protein DDW35_11400 [Candidatus Sumerlaeota bacterium]|jgi:uncharacterized protein (TIGR03435 family)|nr:hypothetical protein [Candidatus Sumerlaeota bacterium]